MYKPNINLPLASSYTERGVTGFTHAVTNSEDQRKINCFYEVSKNSLTGAGKLNLTKRPGVTISASSFGVSTQAAYQIHTSFNDSFPIGPLVFTTVGAAFTVKAEGTSSTTIYSASSGEAWLPLFVDKTIISNVENIVVQLKKTNSYGTQEKVFYCAGSLAAGWVQIVDADFTSGVPATLFNVGKMIHMDGFAFSLTSNNKIINSDLNTLVNWSGLGFITKQIISDVPVGMAKYQNQILAFGEGSVEAYYNAGNATGSPLSPIKQLTNKIGLVHTSYVSGTDYYATINQKMYFIGSETGFSTSNAAASSVGLYAYDGTRYEKISPSSIDKILAEEIIGTQSSYYSMNKIGFFGKSALGISFTAIGAATQRWLMYFPEWNDWFEWTSTIFTPMNNGTYFLGVTPNQHRVYSFKPTDTWQDNGTNFTMQTQFKLPQDGHQRKRMAEFGVLADTARSSNMLSVEFSDDDYVSFINIGAIDLARDIKTLNRGGSYIQRAVRLSSTNALETRLSAFIARIE